jgi:hypothetical protein
VLKAFDSSYFKALLILLPGFLSYEVLAYFGEVEISGDFAIIAVSLAFSLINVFLVEVARSAFFRISKQEPTDTTVTLPFVTLLISVSLISGLAASYIAGNDIILKHFSTTKLKSKKTSLMTILDLCDPVVAKIQVADGRVFRGLLEYYEDNGYVLVDYNVTDSAGRKEEFPPPQRVALFAKDVSSAEFLPLEKGTCPE